MSPDDNNQIRFKSWKYSDENAIVLVNTASGKAVGYQHGLIFLKKELRD